uniref:Secreted protein n=1 Tax=Macrostomum lignano TaxID=282301 RepID=A0A1I8F727_9PLAT
MSPLICVQVVFRDALLLIAILCRAARPDIRVTSPCLSNEERVYFPDEVSRLPELAKPIKSRDGPMPNAHLSLDRVQSRILRQRLRRALRTAARLLLRFGGLLSPAGHETGIPNQRTRRARDQAMAIPTIETEMKLNALIISRLVFSRRSVSSVDADSPVLNLRRQQNHYQLQHQKSGLLQSSLVHQFVKTIVSTSAVCLLITGADSGVYEDPQEPPAW